MGIRRVFPSLMLSTGPRTISSEGHLKDTPCSKNNQTPPCPHPTSRKHRQNPWQMLIGTLCAVQRKLFSKPQRHCIFVSFKTVKRKMPAARFPGSRRYGQYWKPNRLHCGLLATVWFDEHRPKRSIHSLPSKTASKAPPSGMSGVSQAIFGANTVSSQGYQKRL